MTIENLRAQMIARVWQAIAQSGVDLSTIPQAQQETLVGKISDTVLITMNQILGEQAAAVQAPVPPVAPAAQATRAPTPDTATVANPATNDEQILWEGRPFLSLVESYQVTTQRLRIVRGLLSRHIENIELIRIQDMDFKQGLSERMLDIGDIALRTVDTSEPNIVLRNITNPGEVFEILRKAWLEARKAYGVQYRDYMAPPANF